MSVLKKSIEFLHKYLLDNKEKVAEDLKEARKTYTGHGTEWYFNQSEIIDINTQIDNLQPKYMSTEACDEILTGYKWIKIKRYKEQSLDDKEVDWKIAYKELMNHHVEETNFLIEKIRSFVKP